MALYNVPVDYGQDAPAMAEAPEDPLSHFRRMHRELSERHKDITTQLVGTLEKDCARLEREIREMLAQLDTVRSGQPMTEKGGYR